MVPGADAVALARAAVEAEAAGASRPAVPDGPAFRSAAGAFVTLETYPGGSLRGCIGIPEPVMPLGEAIVGAACSACHDPRFPPLGRDETGKVTVEVTILTPPCQILFSDPADLVSKIVIGRDGLIMEFMGRRGLFLPQVPVEQGWDTEEYLDSLCMKSGLPPGTWRREGVRIESFRGEAWHETVPRGPAERRDDIVQ